MLCDMVTASRGTNHKQQRVQEQWFLVQFNQACSDAFYEHCIVFNERLHCRATYPVKQAREGPDGWSDCGADCQRKGAGVVGRAGLQDPGTASAGPAHAPKLSGLLGAHLCTRLTGPAACHQSVLILTVWTEQLGLVDDQFNDVDDEARAPV